jgi:hypothetical protein
VGKSDGVPTSPVCPLNPPLIVSKPPLICYVPIIPSVIETLTLRYRKIKKKDVLAFMNLVTRRSNNPAQIETMILKLRIICHHDTLISNLNEIIY